MYNYMKSGRHPKDIDMLSRSDLIYNNEYMSAFETFAGNADLVTSIMSSQFNPLGRTMGDILNNDGILNKTNPKYANVYEGHEGTGEFRQKIDKAAPFKPGSTEQAIKREKPKCK